MQPVEYLQQLLQDRSSSVELVEPVLLLQRKQFFYLVKYPRNDRDWVGLLKPHHILEVLQIHQLL